LAVEVVQPQQLVLAQVVLVVLVIYLQAVQVLLELVHHLVQVEAVADISLLVPTAQA
jgi:hypothetical protein